MACNLLKSRMVQNNLVTLNRYCSEFTEEEDDKEEEEK